MQALLRWYDRHGRNLPWRKTRNGYRIFISELMLQQTQVERVIPKYQAWLKHFPSWQRLAHAKTDELLHAWAGLGYNRRALQARDAARYVVDNGEPSTEEEWRALKGVGPYMAAALAEFVNHQRAIVIDTNVRRVVGRLFLGKPTTRPEDDSRLRRALEKITPQRARHWDIPQAFMDLGSIICTPRNPQCARCPLQKKCKAGPKFLSGKTIKHAPIKKTNERRFRNKQHPDRIYRGRILAWIREHGPTPISRLGRRIDEVYDVELDDPWIQRMCIRLAKDGLLEINAGDILSLPHS